MPAAAATTIVIAICTCAREQLLSECLRSLDTLQIPDNVAVTVTVIDNATDQSARPVVDNYNNTGKFRAEYVIEPRRGIPFARNRALDFALQQGIDQLIFIDDDEYVTPEWLITLVSYSRSKSDNAVISGAVKSVVPDQVPDHISVLFTREKSGRTGDRLQACATNNVLIPMHLISQRNLRFDESNPLAGGTDTIFFVNAIAQGVEIYKCKEALVYEKVPLSRANLRWLSKRKYRVGVTEAWRKRQNGRSSLRVLFSALVSMLAQLLVCVLACIVNNKLLRNKAWLRVSKGAGTISGLLGSQVDSYRNIEK